MIEHLMNECVRLFNRVEVKNNGSLRMHFEHTNKIKPFYASIGGFSVQCETFEESLRQLKGRLISNIEGKIESRRVSLETDITQIQEMENLLSEVGAQNVQA